MTEHNLNGTPRKRDGDSSLPQRTDTCNPQKAATDSRLRSRDDVVDGSRYRTQQVGILNMCLDVTKQAKDSEFEARGFVCLFI